MIKQVVEIPQEELDKIQAMQEKVNEMHSAFQNMGNISTPEYHTIPEFIKKGKMCRNTFESIKDKLDIRKVSARKYLIPHSDLVKYLNGEFLEK